MSRATPGFLSTQGKTVDIRRMPRRKPRDYSGLHRALVLIGLCAMSSAYAYSVRPVQVNDAPARPKIEHLFNRAPAPVRGHTDPVQTACTPMHNIHGHFYGEAAKLSAGIDARLLHPVKVRP